MEFGGNLNEAWTARLVPIVLIFAMHQVVLIFASIVLIVIQFGSYKMIYYYCYLISRDSRAVQ